MIRPLSLVAFLLAGSFCPGSPAGRLVAQAPSPAAPAAQERWREATATQVAEARERTLAACRQQQIELPADFLAWVDGDPQLTKSVYGCRAEPLSVLLALRSLELDLGDHVVRRDYTQLALAFAIQGSYAGRRGKALDWNDGADETPGAALPDVRPRSPLVLTIPGDPRVRVDTKDPSRPRDRDDHIVDFLEGHAPIEVDEPFEELPPLEYDEAGRAKPRGKPVKGVRKVSRPLVAADVIASAALQAEFHAHMTAHGHPDVKVDCGDRAVHWFSVASVDDDGLRQRIAAAHELFLTAYRTKGRMPAERDKAPTAAESMAWFVRNDRHAFPPEVRNERRWPRFPLQAPWPLLLMLAADDQPLREREAIWTAFRDRGELKTYGEYIGDIAQQFDMQSARRLAPFPFAYGSIQMMWKDGGVCGTMGNIGARTWRIAGVPAATAGQPGHCALVRMDHDPKTGRFRCIGEQYASGGDEATTVHAGWNHDDRGGRRPMAFHQAIVWSCERSFDAHLDTMAMRRAFDRLPAERRGAEALACVEAALAQNPFALVVLDGVVAALDDADSLLAVVDTFERVAGSALDPKEHALYRTTVIDLVHARIGALPQAEERAANERLLTRLEQQNCRDAALLARTWRAIDGEQGFTARCRAELEAYLASEKRGSDRRLGRDTVARVKALAATVKGKARKAAFANELLPLFDGKQTLTIRGKAVVDPVVLELCKLAGREPPAIDAGR